ncbi:MAG: T9SS type A sorting domain-containing protein [Chitinophagales bacterium]|nr:T9SS type A sorting domain-containing protein [Chitinophagales bacterium]
MKRNILLLYTLFSAMQLRAQEPTWSSDVATIIYDNCSSCHREGGIGPFPLMSYDDALTNGYGIATQVAAKLMPPWKPNPDYVHFQNERFLSADQMTTIADWVNAGYPSGDLATAPAPPVFTSISQMTEIDQTLKLPEWTVSSDIDQYRSFVIPAGASAGKYLKQIEYLPGNNAIVHHIVIWADPTNISQTLDDLDPLPGFESNGTMPASIFASLIGAWAPGSGLFSLPENMGIKIESNFDYVVEIHYAPGSLNQSDSTAINLKFTDYPMVRQVYVDAVLQYFFGMTDGPLFIPANTVKTFHESYDLNGYNVSLIGVFPHMHRIGSSFKSWTESSSGAITPLIDIPKWSFHWQGFYNYQKLIPVFSGSTFWAEATYDNTTNNPDNPSNPPQDVSAGEHTTDEMMIGFFAFTEYMPGDENVVLDSSLVSGSSAISPTPFSLRMFPNPVNEQLNVEVTMKVGSFALFELYDIRGSLISSAPFNHLNEGIHVTAIPVSGLAPGIYLLKVQTAGGMATGRFVKE